MTIMRINGRKSAIPLGCAEACARRSSVPEHITSTSAIIFAFPAQAGRHLPWPAGSFRSPKMLPRFFPRPAHLILPFEACLKVRAESSELSKTDSLPNFPHDVKVKVDVVMGIQDACQRLTRGIKMPQICTRIPAANRALTFFVYGPLVVRIARVLDEQASLRREKATMPRAAGGEHAIHHVDSEAHVVRKLVGLANAHQVARLACGQARSGRVRHRARCFVRFTYSKTTVCVAGKIQSDKRVSILAAELCMRAALHDSEKRLPRRVAMALKIVPRSSRPGERASCCISCPCFCRGRFDAFIENHDDVRTQRNFDF